MGKRKYEVSDKIAYRWCERHRRGDSFRKIGLDEGYDRRFVARVVRRYDRQEHLEEGAVTLRDVRVGFLREHLRDLERAAGHILELTAGPSVWGQLIISSGNIESVLIDMTEQEHIPYGSVTDRQASRVIMEHTPPGTITQESANQLAPVVLQFAERLGKRRARREAKAIIEALKQHLPDLWKQVEGWQQVALGYETTWRQLVEQARDMGIAEDLLESGLQKGLDFISRSQEEDSLPRAPTKFETASDVGLWLFQNPRTRESLELFYQYREQWETAYAELEDMLSPFELRKALLARQCKYCPLP